MAVGISQIKDKLVEKGLKVTPQRIAILEAIYTLNNHPSAEMIMEYIKDTHPGIASATVYTLILLMALPSWCWRGVWRDQSHTG